MGNSRCNKTALEGVEQMVVTYNDLYLDLRKQLRREGIEAASLEARVLLCAAADKRDEQLMRDMQLYAPNEVQTKLAELVDRRRQGEPVAYLVGEWEFYGIPLKVNEHVLIPRPDTETLAERAVELIRKAGSGARILDLCTGTGCIGIAVAMEVQDCRAVLVDASEEAIELCKENIRRNQLNARVTAAVGDVCKKPDAALWDFDVITCNPPYIPTGDIAGLDTSVRDYEPHKALDGGVDGLDFYRAVAPLWAESLQLGGTLLFEIGIHQDQAVQEIMQQAGYVDIIVHRDPADIPRVVEGRVPEAQKAEEE